MAVVNLGTYNRTVMVHTTSDSVHVKFVQKGVAEGLCDGLFIETATTARELIKAGQLYLDTFAPTKVGDA